MIFNKAAVSTLLLAGSAAAFTPSKVSSAFVSSTASTGSSAFLVSSVHAVGCPCAACSIRSHSASCSCALCKSHSASCACGLCRRTTMLFSEASAAAETAELPVEVESLDGIESKEEAHNTERPARKSLKKKPPRGKPLSEFKIGDSVKAKVKTITTYGAFLDIGATTDGLLHISQLAVGFVADVNEILKEGQELDVRITKIDEGKNQVALTLLTADQEVEAKDAASRSRQPREQRPQRGSGGNRQQRDDKNRDDSAVLAKLVEKGWSSEQFVEGKVVSTVDFGAFVRINASQLNQEVEGEFDGLVHISALTAGRASSVTSIVNVDDTVKVRVKAIADRKVSLTMVSPEDEAAKNEKSGDSAPQGEGAKDWKESLMKMQSTMPEFKNRPLVVSSRK